MSIITTTSTTAKAPAWLDLDALVDPATRRLFDELASEIETACYEHQELLLNAHAALELLEGLRLKACADLTDAMGDEGRELHDGISALLDLTSGANRLSRAMRHLSEGFDPETENWTPGAYIGGEG